MLRPLATLLVAAILAAPALAGAKEVRVGYQKYGQLILLKQKGWLEPALAAHGDTVSWKPFTAGPQLVEALDAGAIDLAITGEAPPVLGQAAGAPIVYIGAEPPSPTGEAIVVPNASPLHDVAELRGKRVAVNRGSNVQWFLVRALDAANIGWSGITPLYLSPPDATAAFSGGSLPAWAIWDPFLASAQVLLGARVLRDATGLAANRQFFLATRAFADGSPDRIAIFLAAERRLDAWGAAHRDAVGPMLAAAAGLDPKAAALAATRLPFGMTPLTPQIVADQQQIADGFLKLGLIPEAIHVADAVWHPPHQ